MNFILKNNKILIFILILAAFLRFYKLSEFPVHLGHDEVSQLYDAISIAQTGSDIYGNPYPFIFQSVNDYKAPFYIYATSVAYRLFGWQEVTARVVGAFFGTLVVIGVYFFAKSFLKDKHIAFVAAFLTAISPFEIFYSRKGFENQSGVFLMLIGFACLMTYLKSKNIKFAYAGVVSLGFATYIYFAQAILTPILLTIFIILFLRSKRLAQKSLRPLIIFLLIVIPLAYMIFFNPHTRNRSSAVFITQDPKVGQSLTAKDAFAKLLTLGTFASKRYIQQFNPSYLFFNGLNMTEGKRDVGPLFPVLIPFLLGGVYVLVKKKDVIKERLFIFAWILITMLPSGLTFEDYSPHRAIGAFTMLNIVAAVGVHSFSKKYGRLGLLVLAVLLIGNFVFFTKRYTVNYPIEKSEALHYPYEEVAVYAWENYDKYETIVFDPKFGEFAPWIGTGAHYYLAFYGHYPPAKMQTEFTTGDQSKRETKFDKFSIRAVFWPEDMILKNTLFIASPWSLPPDIEERANIIKKFYFKTTAPAFFAIEP